MTQDDTPCTWPRRPARSMFGPDWRDIDGSGRPACPPQCHRLPADRPCRGHPAPGLHGRKQIIDDYYPKRRRKWVRRTILFENWKGKQYSDNLRAIDEELQRRRDRRKRIWVVRDHSVRMPAGCARCCVSARVLRPAGTFPVGRRQ